MSAKAAFVDTAGWMMLADAADPAHDRARSFRDTWWEWIDPDRAEQARQWFFRWRDKAFSFTDCTSFVVMKERRLRTAFTSDRHFAQAGFQVVPPGR